MNKRIKKKNSEARINAMIIKVIDLISDYRLVYARLVGRENLHNINDDFRNGYYNWNKSITGRKTWNYMLRKNNLHNYMLCVNKVFKKIGRKEK